MANRGDRIGREDKKDDEKTENSDDEEAVEDDNVFEVEKIVGMTTNDGKVMYRVRWLNYSSLHDTWEPLENLLTCQDLVEEYVNREGKKKRKPTPEKSAKKRKKFSKKKDVASNEDESVAPQQPPPKSAETKEPVKDRFWKDLEERNINIFEGGDMYSKVKERSSIRQEIEKKRKPKETVTSEGSGSLAKGKNKPRRRISVACLSSSDSEDKNGKHLKHTTESPSREISDCTPQNFVISTLVKSQEDIKSTDKPRDVQKNKKSINLLKSGTQTSQTANKQLDLATVKKKLNDENNMPVRRTQVDYNLVKSPRVESNEIRFEFRQYNPEEWISKEAYNSTKIIDLTNVQFRDAVKEGDYERLRRALNSKTAFNMEQCDSSGTTLLMIAAMSGFDDVVELLVMRGANINACQKNGCTALMLAADRGHTCVVAVLLGLGAHMDMQIMSGETALMKACRKGNRQVVQLLLEYGANYAAVTNGDQTALKLAKLYDRSGIDSLLKDHSARVMAAFEAEVYVTLNNTAEIKHALFPIHCFALNEGTVFKINFNHQLKACQSGVGMLLFIAHARITSQEIKCRFYGPCAVVSAFLNGEKQLPLTQDANFVFSFSPLQNGKNELIINTVPAIVSKSKLIVCAYKAQLNNQRS